jgi:hypothetical protein
MTNLLRIAFAIVSLGVAAANAQTTAYHSPAQNYYQNSWMGGGD